MVRIRSHLRRIMEALPRLWWGALILLHLPILAAVSFSIVRSGPDFSSLGSLIALLAAMAFFVLKLQDVAFLRLRTRQQSFIAMCLITAIVHVDAVAPAADDAAVLPTVAVLVTAIAAGPVLRRGGTLLRRWHDLLTARFAQPALVRPIFDRHGGLPASVLRSLCDTRPTVPRAPPA